MKTPLWLIPARRGPWQDQKLQTHGLLEGEEVCERIWEMLPPEARKSRRNRFGPWLAVLRLDPCCYCGTRPAGTVDHIVPVRVGAMRMPKSWNATAACECCNQEKGSASLLGFLVARAWPGLVYPYIRRLELWALGLKNGGQG